jgi:L-glyceraldehyde 3-phosphate reductase
LRNEKMTSTLISTSKIKQLEENLNALNNMHFSDDEIKLIDEILSS